MIFWGLKILFSCFIFTSFILFDVIKQLTALLLSHWQFITISMRQRLTSNLRFACLILLNLSCWCIINNIVTLRRSSIFVPYCFFLFNDNFETFKTNQIISLIWGHQNYKHWEGFCLSLWRFTLILDITS